MDGKIVGTSKKEITLDTDWLTALLAGCGLLFIFVVIGSDFWRIVHGQFASPTVARQSPFWRLWDSFFFAFAAFICVKIVLRSDERILRFAFGLMSVGILAHLVKMWIPLSSSAVRTLNAMSLVVDLPGFVLLAVYGLKWFRSKVVHC